MNRLVRGLPLTYGAILVCFLFTFVNISCQGDRYASLTGVQLAFGTTIETQKVFGGTEKKKIEPAPLVMLAFFAAVAGLVAGLIRNNKIAAIAGVAGFILLLLYKSNTDGDVTRQGNGMIQIDYGGGFVTSVVLFGAAVIIASGMADRLLGGAKEVP